MNTPEVRLRAMTAADIPAVEGIGGATITTDGYKTAILRCFAAVQILEGGAE